jgi:hypothetical protein
MQEEDKRLFIQLLEAFSLEQRNNQVWDSVSVTDILRTQKIWVCRHFSRIAKMIFKG